MAEQFVISCCSTADMTKEHFAARDIKYICFHYQLDGKDYADDLGQSISFPDFYAAMSNGAETKTSQVNAEEYEQYFEQFLKEGKDILHLSLSSGISGSVNSANIAKDTLQERYPDRKIYVVDSLAASSGFGLLMDKIADLRDEGKSIDEILEWVDEAKVRLHHWFFSTDLTFFVKGGRVSKTAGFVGNILDICPLLNVNDLGQLIPRFKIRGKRRVIREIVKQMELYAQDGADYREKCFLSHSACYEDAVAVAQLVEEKFPKMKGKVEIFDIGTTIGSHTGPGTVALFFWGTERER